MYIDKDLIISKLQKEETILLPTQDAISLPIIFRIYNKMKHRLDFKAIHVNEDWIIDGHHRYISSILAEFRLESIPNYPKPSELNVCSWNDVCFTDEEWDTKDSIRRLNRQDAKYNGISVETVERMIE